MSRRGEERAIRAVAHSIMVRAFYMLVRNAPYRECRGNYFDERQRHYTVDRLAARLERLGYRVPLEPVVATTEQVIFKVTCRDPHLPHKP